MNWEEMTITLVILGFGPPKIADRIWYALQAYQIRQRSARNRRAKAESFVRLRYFQEPRFLPSSYLRCRCTHEALEHMESGACTHVTIYPYVSEDVTMTDTDCHCPGYTPARGG